MGGLALLYSRPAPAVGAAAAGGWISRSTQLETFVPRNAFPGLRNPGAAAYAWSAYEQLSAGLANDFIPHAIALQFGAQALVAAHNADIIEIEVATGAAGAEVEYGRAIEVFDAYAAVAGSDPFSEWGRTYDFGTTVIPAGTRIAWRVRASLAQASCAVVVVCYLAGYDTSVPASDTTYPLDAHLGGSGNPQTLVTPWGATTAITQGGAWAYGAWVDVFNTAPQDLLLWGAHQLLAPVGSNQSGYLAFAIGAPGAEVAYKELAMPARVPFAVGTHRARRPLLVLSGERVRAARRGVVTGSIPHQFIYTLV